ncbi:MAG: hypothetical protein ACYS8W_20075 [Planctomycetota bacterium]
MEKKPCDRCKNEISHEQGGAIKFDLKVRRLCSHCLSYIRAWFLQGRKNENPAFGHGHKE